MNDLERARHDLDAGMTADELLRFDPGSSQSYIRDIVSDQVAVRDLVAPLRRRIELMHWHGAARDAALARCSDILSQAMRYLDRADEEIRQVAAFLEYVDHQYGKVQVHVVDYLGMQPKSGRTGDAARRQNDELVRALLRRGSRVQFVPELPVAAYRTERSEAAVFGVAKARTDVKIVGGIAARDLDLAGGEL